MNFHFVTSNHISTYRKINLPHKQYLFSRLFYFVWKRNEPKILKTSRCKNLSLQCVYFCYDLLWWIFFIPCDNWKTVLFIKVYHYSEIFLTILFSFLWRQFSSSYFMHYLHNNRAYYKTTDHRQLITDPLTLRLVLHQPANYQHSNHR